MSTAADTRLRGRTRWSAAARCPRWAAMGLLGHDPAPPDDRTQRLWLRGKMLGVYMADRFAARYGEEQVVREKAVPWPATGLPLGELHTDVYIAPERMAVEVKSSSSPASLLDDALTQLAGEVHFDPEADIGGLAIVDPVDLAEELTPFILTDEAIEHVETIAALVADAGKTGTLPPCSACNPTECHFKGCPYTGEAWAGWLAPVPGKLTGEAAGLVRELYAAKQARAVRKAEHEQADQAYKDICARLSELGVDAGEYDVGPLRLRRTDVEASERFSLSKARKSGVWASEHDGLFQPFLTLAGAHSRWSVEKVGDGPTVTVDNFGEDVPF